jgi:hypothetical protein
MTNELIFTFSPYLNLHCNISQYCGFLNTMVPIRSHDQNSKSKLKTIKHWEGIPQEPPRASTFVWETLLFSARMTSLLGLHPCPLTTCFFLSDWTWKYPWIWHFPDTTQGVDLTQGKVLCQCSLPRFYLHFLIWDRHLWPANKCRDSKSIPIGLTHTDILMWGRLRKEWHSSWWAPPWLLTLKQLAWFIHSVTKSSSHPCCLVSTAWNHSTATHSWPWCSCWLSVSSSHV